MIARGEELKAEMLRNPDGAPAGEQALDRDRNQVRLRIPASRLDQISDGIERALIALGDWIADDEQFDTAVNNGSGSPLLRIIAPRRAEIGAFITQVVERWDTETLVNRIELQVGRDLQYIRINGTLVGGLVGLIIFTANAIASSLLAGQRPCRAVTPSASLISWIAASNDMQSGLSVDWRRSVSVSSSCSSRKLRPSRRRT